MAGRAQGKLKSLEEAKRQASVAIMKLEAQIKETEEELSSTSNFNSPRGYTPYNFHPQPDSRDFRVEKALGEISQALSLTRLPQAEPFVFSGDPLTFNRWEADVNLLLDSCNIPSREKLQILTKYLSGTAKAAVENLTMVPLANGYEEARRILSRRFGNPYHVADAFRTKLENFPKISPKDADSLQAYSDLLNQIKTVKTSLKELSILDDIRENKKMSSKLPDWLTQRWARHVSEHSDEYGYPDFKHFCDFVERETQIACNPVFGIAAEGPTLNEKRVTHLSKQEDTLLVRKCAFCSMTNHSTGNCRGLGKLSETNIKQFISNNHLCFKCLCEGHSYRDCPTPTKCKICYSDHATVLHKSREAAPTMKTSVAVGTEKAEVLDHRLVQDVKGNSRSMSAMIVPVDIWERSNGRRYTTYALLDTQSDTTFVTNKVAGALQAQGIDTMLSVSTMISSKQVIKCKKYNGLLISAHGEGNTFSLPPTYSREKIPANMAHVPTRESASCFPHLKGVLNRLPKRIKANVGLLIGYDCPHALAPLACVKGGVEEPYAVKTPLGWSIVGFTGKKHTGEQNRIGISHRVEGLEVHASANNTPQCMDLISKRQAKGKGIPSADVIPKTFTQDLTEISDLKHTASVECKEFLKTSDEGLSHSDGTKYMPPPSRTTLVEIKGLTTSDRRIQQVKSNPLSDTDHSEYYHEQAAVVSETSGYPYQRIGNGLHKSLSNNTKVIKPIPLGANTQETNLSLDALHEEQALGLQWQLETYSFHFPCQPRKTILTRRGILSHNVTGFELLGFLAHCFLKGKQISRDLCVINIEWDEPIPPDLKAGRPSCVREPDKTRNTRQRIVLPMLYETRYK